MSGFGRNRRGHIGGDAGGGDDLMITPLLDLFVALIPFLIVSMVLTKIHIVDVGISKPVALMTQKQNSNFDLLLKVGSQSAQILLNGAVVSSVSKTPDDAWLNTVRLSLVELKKKNPDEYKIRIEAEGKVTLQVLMSFMDQARKLKPEDGEILRKDETGKPVKLQYLFPNVILKGIYG